MSLFLDICTWTVFQVSAEVSRRSLSLAVDSSKPGLVSIRGNQLDVEKRLYLGGLPHAHTTRRINVGHFFFCNNQSKCPLMLRSVIVAGVLPASVVLTLRLSLLCISDQQQFSGLHSVCPPERCHVGPVQTSLAA